MKYRNEGKAKMKEKKKKKKKEEEEEEEREKSKRGALRCVRPECIHHRIVTRSGEQHVSLVTSRSLEKCILLSDYPHYRFHYSEIIDIYFFHKSLHIYV